MNATRIVKVVVRAEKLLLVTYYRQNSKIRKILPLKNLVNFLKALTVKLSIFTNKRTSHSEILIQSYK